MSDEYEPPIHIVPRGDKWGICLSRLAKIITAIVVTVVSALILGALGFMWAINAKLAKLDELPTRIYQMEIRLIAQVEETRKLSINNSERISKIEGRTGL